MRLRHKPWAAEKLQSYPQYVTQNPQDFKGKWQKRFAKDQPIHIEVGSGKGQFIIGMAKAHPQINYVAIELQTSVAVSILELQLAEELENLQIINAHGGDLSTFFQTGEVSRVYLNFSDPWPKARHSKRRLTSPKFLSQYQTILNSEGDIHFKTDNMGLFQYSLASLSQYGYVLRQVWLDLHNSDFEGNIQTEYEEKFSTKGHPIYRLEAYLPTKD
ncbi:tRNA (guanosine(46)-N7)-methyltransferase TrmB [Facklamia miroungae]|uniref:tRNA (guanine-N(7)-)-methyltransferase n=1 Tax=Facklamia miroungae TaxID=120956 RepID=A0A1G7TKM1_9LACT|nr:tRNA (guanosine(46)-N7)-methyltransferase TrmB [Facklamia miroungae]NKZ29799.1 tRNA (guanosine(46)-N7)-methyltransferase TrmB [Facklamia miroungae]SDG35815.1 tRNA (guanine-N7-)-methyltransferase [Facklamia miroungae]